MVEQARLNKNLVKMQFWEFWVYDVQRLKLNNPEWDLNLRPEAFSLPEFDIAP